MQATKRLPLVLDVADYRQLAALAAIEDRDPAQQARFMIRRALEQNPESQTSRVESEQTDPAIRLDES